MIERGCTTHEMVLNPLMWMARRRRNPCGKERLDFIFFSQSFLKTVIFGGHMYFFL